MDEYFTLEHIREVLLLLETTDPVLFSKLDTPEKIVERLSIKPQSDWIDSISLKEFQECWYKKPTLNTFGVKQ